MSMPASPRPPISRQTDHDKLWIREPFLNSRFNFGKHVVHGHTPLQGDKPDVQRNRTNLDTGAAWWGRPGTAPGGLPALRKPTLRTAALLASAIFGIMAEHPERASEPRQPA